jgi:hypothetical protein
VGEKKKSNCQFGENFWMNFWQKKKQKKAKKKKTSIQF